MPAITTIALVLSCVSVLLFASFTAARLRRRFSKSAAAAASFAIPGALAALPALWLLTESRPLVALPAVTIAALFGLAAVIFAPTAATRFAAFERDFWAHIDRHG